MQDTLTKIVRAGMLNHILTQFVAVLFLINYDVNHGKVVPLISNACLKRQRNILGSIMSKGADKSRSVITEIYLSCRPKDPQ